MTVTQSSEERSSVAGVVMNCIESVWDISSI